MTVPESIIRQPAIRVIMMPKDTNPVGTIFGGVILSYIDQAGIEETKRKAPKRRFVTVAMREVIFKQPVFVGDAVSFYADTIKVGNTSLTVRVEVEAARWFDPSQVVQVTEAEIVFVSTDPTGKPVPIFPNAE